MRIQARSLQILVSNRKHLCDKDCDILQNGTQNSIKSDDIMKKKYIFITFSLAIGGAEKRIACIANHLAKTGNDVKIILLERAPIAQEIDARVQIVFLDEQLPPRISWHKTFFEKLLLKSTGLFLKKQNAILEEKIRLQKTYANKLHILLRKEPASVVISFMTFPSISTAMALKGTTQHRWVFVECNSPHVEFAADSVVPKIRKEFYALAYGAAFQTEEARDYYTFLPRLRTAVIPNPLPSITVPIIHGPRPKTVVTFCRMSTQKNIPLLLDAFTKFSQKHAAYTLHVYGDGLKKNEWISYAKTLPSRDKIVFHSAERDVAQKVCGEGMFVSSSDREGISNAMLEAMAVGLPCICTDCPAGGARMFIKSYENGILVPVRDVDAMADAMCYFAEHPKEAEQCGNNAKKIAEILAPDRIFAAWDTFLEEIGENHV